MDILHEETMQARNEHGRIALEYKAISRRKRGTVYVVCFTAARYRRVTNPNTVRTKNSGKLSHSSSLNVVNKYYSYANHWAFTLLPGFCSSFNWMIAQDA